MNPLLFICYKNCSTCKKAEAFLQQHGIPYIYREIDKENPNEAELRTWSIVGGIDTKRFFNTSGQLYRSLGVKDKLAAGMTDAQQFALLSTDGMLVKRPLLVGESFVAVGFKPEVWEGHFANLSKE